MSRGGGSRRGGGLAGGGIGVLGWVVPPGLVDGVVAGVRERRLRWLPSRFGVYFVLGLCLFSYLPYGQVVRELTAGLDAGLALAYGRGPGATEHAGGGAVGATSFGGAGVVARGGGVAGPVVDGAGGGAAAGGGRAAGVAVRAGV